MSTIIIWLLITNLALNIITLCIVLDMKYNKRNMKEKPTKVKTEKKCEFGNRLKSALFNNDDIDYDITDDFDDDICDEPEYRVIENSKSNGRIEKLRKKWEEEDIEENNNILEYNKLRDINEFMKYVSDYNLDIVDILSGKVKRIKYLDNASYFDETIHKYQQTVSITFTDGTTTLFVPNKFAKVNYNLNVA